MDIDQEKLVDHTKNTLRDALTITGVMIAALFAAEGRMPDFTKIGKFLVVYVGLVVLLKLGHQEVAKQVMTAAAIGCGSKLLEIISKK